MFLALTITLLLTLPVSLTLVSCSFMQLGNFFVTPLAFDKLHLLFQTPLPVSLDGQLRILYVHYFECLIRAVL